MERVGVEETQRFAREFVRGLEPKQDHATVIGLSGELGSGKTTFVQAAARELGITEHITSPTFVILKRYTVKHRVFDALVHIDAYRLENGEDLSELGFETFLQDSQNLILIEWPERVQDILPNYATIIDFKFISEHTRHIAPRDK